MELTHSLITDQSSFARAVAAAKAAATAYYESAEVTMPDAEYDALVELIEAAKNAHHDWDDRGVTTEVAAGSAVGSNTDPGRMLSLDKSKSLAEVRAFVATLPGAVIVEPKLDGCAVRVTFVDGKLVAVAARDARASSDLTVPALRGAGFCGLPRHLSRGWSGEVRGEVYMTDADFESANKARAEVGKPFFVNPRNATAGALRRVDATYEVRLSFAAYDMTAAVPGRNLSSYRDQMRVAADLGVTTALSLMPDMRLQRGDEYSRTEVVLATIEALGEARSELGFPIDGAVVKADDYSARAMLGAGSRAPRWATAWKYPADTATTRLRAVEVSVGRTGRLGFRFAVDPVFVGGTTIRWVTAHNAPWIVGADLRIGDEVWVYRAGDVIPRITTANLAARPAGAERWVAPTVCPQCEETLDRTSLLYRCCTPSCSVVGRIGYAASRDCLDIDGLDTATAEALVESGLVANIADLYDLTVADVAAVRIGSSSTGQARLIGKATAARIVGSIQDSKAQPLHRTVTALGIKGTGRSMSRALAKSFGSMGRLRGASVDEIARIDKIGSVKARLIHDGLAELSEVIDRLAAHGLAMSVPDTGAVRPLADKTYVVSGSVPGYTRTTIAERIEALGGKASSSVSRTTTALVTSETTTAKALKAAQLGVPVVDPSDFAAMIADLT
jgi:DNA ligase (NAD+)